jgi:ribosomal protein L29
MSAQETNEIRELTQAELDEVAGAATAQFRGRYQLKLAEASDNQRRRNNGRRTAVGLRRPGDGAWSGQSQPLSVC